MNRPEFFDIMSLVEDEHINILYERRAKAAENKLSAKGGKKLITLWFKRIALVLITTATVLAGILMLHEDVRAAVVNAFITWYDTYIQIDFSKIPEDTAQIDGTTDTVPADKEPEPVTENKDIYDLEIGYIPDGFELSQSDENINYREYIYYNKSDQYLVIGIYLSKETEIAISKEDDAEYEKIKLNDTDAYIYYVESDKTGSITYSNSVYLVNIAGIIEKDELIKIAENIRKKDSNGEEEQDQEVKDIYKFEIGYIPDGFELSQSDENINYREYIYYNKSDQYLVVGIYLSEETVISISKEDDAEYEKIKLNDTDAYIYYVESDKTGSITYSNSVYLVNITGIIEKDELIKIAENIREKDSNGEEEQDQEVNDIYKFEIGYIPDGFELFQSQEDVSLRNYIYTNVNEPDEYLIIDFCLSEWSEYWLGYDDSAEYDQIKLNGTDAYIFYNKQEKTGAIMFGNSVYFVSITGYVEKDELIKIAENIREKDSNGEEEQDQEVKDIYKFEIGYIPDGFELMGADESSTYRNYTYYNKIGEYLNFYLATSGTTEIFSSIEKAECDKITVNGNDAYILYYDSEKTGTIMFGNSVYTVLVSGVIEKNELIKIAESIK